MELASRIFHNSTNYFLLNEIHINLIKFYGFHINLVGFMIISTNSRKYVGMCVRESVANTSISIKRQTYGNTKIEMNLNVNNYI